MLKLVEQCACQALDDHLDSKVKEPLVILTRTGLENNVRGMIASRLVALGGKCHGDVWKTPRLPDVYTKRFSDPADMSGYRLAVCNDGTSFQAEESENISIWRSRASKR